MDDNLMRAARRAFSAGRAAYGAGNYNAALRAYGAAVTAYTAAGDTRRALSVVYSTRYSNAGITFHCPHYATPTEPGDAHVAAGIRATLAAKAVRAALRGARVKASMYHGAGNTVRVTPY